MSAASTTISMTWTDSRLLFGGSGLTFALGCLGFSVALGGVSGPAIALSGAVSALWATGVLLVEAARGLTAVSTDDERLEAQAAVGRRRRELQREYHLLKRALKELELDRSMGKLSDDDYAEIRGRYRERAVRILRQLDQGQSYEQQIERDLAARREALGKKPAPDKTTDKAPDNTSDQPADSTVAAATKDPAARPASSQVPTVIASACPECGTRNDIDARFCKHCGHKLGGAK
ncbi:MAG: zinc ribbon domain-containing protein [Myxococcales bacterium]|nr:zinc ribbon domain-containing protein [Myxococcales bacterium]